MCISQGTFKEYWNGLIVTWLLSFIPFLISLLYDRLLLLLQPDGANTILID